MVNIALIGLGLIGKTHAQLIIKNKNTQLIGIVEVNPSLEDKKNFGSIIFPNLDELYKSSKIDGVIIASPSPLHVEHAKFFIKKGIPVLIEKPISHNSKNVLNLINLAKKKSVPIVVGHHRRHNNIIKKTKELITNNKLGKVRSVQSLCWFYKPDKYFDLAPWRKKKGAGPISINLIHDVDLLRYLCGEVQFVQATSHKSIRGYQNEDIASAILHFKNGIIATISVSDSIVSPWSWEMNSKENLAFPQTSQSSYLVGGSLASLSVPDMKIWKHKSKVPNWWTPMYAKKTLLKSNNPLKDQLNHFCRVISRKEKPLVSGLEGYKSLLVVEAIEKSSQKKITIKMK
jgi:predicted dehydrogenase